MAYDRITLQQLAELRLAEAKSLIASGQPSGAYYLAGYAIECALKARIANEFREGEIPKLSLVQRTYTHDLVALLSLAGLKDELDASMKESSSLNRRWTTAKNWSEEARYNIWTQEAAEAMLDAIDGDGEALLPWLKKR